MTFMAFMLLIILFGVFFLFFWNLNPHDVTIHLFGNQDFTYPVAFVVIGGILIGLMLGFGAHIYSSLMTMWKHWKRDQAEKLNREVGTIYREGVDHLLSGDLKKARELLQKALDRDPRRVETLDCPGQPAQPGRNSGRGSGRSCARPATSIPRTAKCCSRWPPSRRSRGRRRGPSPPTRRSSGANATTARRCAACATCTSSTCRWKDALDTQRLIFKAGPDTSRLAEEKEKLLYLRYEVARLALGKEPIDLAKSEFKDLIRQMPEFTPARVSLGDALCGPGARRRSDPKSGRTATWPKGKASF